MGEYLRTLISGQFPQGEASESSNPDLAKSFGSLERIASNHHMLANPRKLTPNATFTGLSRDELRKTSSPETIELANKHSESMVQFHKKSILERLNAIQSSNEEKK